MKWGLRWELCILVVFVICLLFVTIGLNRFGLLSGEEIGNVVYLGEDKDDNFDYGSLETEIKNAAKKYYNLYLKNKSGSTYVSVRDMRDTNTIDKLYDGEGRGCTGYAEITEYGSAFPYLKCPRYKTKGYKNNHE